MHCSSTNPLPTPQRPDRPRSEKTGRVRPLRASNLLELAVRIVLERHVPFASRVFRPRRRRRRHVLHDIRQTMELVERIVVPEFLRGGSRLIAEREGRFVAAIKCVPVAPAFFVECMALDSYSSLIPGPCSSSHPADAGTKPLLRLFKIVRKSHAGNGK